MVNSTALGGGVAQLLRTLLPYWRGAGMDVRWIVLRGSAEFFRVTKRFHNHLQGQPDDGGVLGIGELTIFDRAADYYARALASLLGPGDVVVLNDPQTAAMSVPLERAGANRHWSCQLGFLPRLRIAHTSEETIGQSYVPWITGCCCCPS